MNRLYTKACMVKYLTLMDLPQKFAFVDIETTGTSANRDRIIERENIKIKNRHRAFDDAKVMWEFFKKTQKRFKQEKFESVINILLKKPTLPIKISHQDLDNLPEGPGVYVFYGANNCCLYVGKSVNVRSRVLSHFSSDHASSKEMNMA